MNIFDFSTGIKEKKVINMVEQMKGILISYFGKERANSICSILDDTNYIFVPKRVVSDPSVIEKYTEAELGKLGIDFTKENSVAINSFLNSYDYDALGQLLETSMLENDLPQIYHDGKNSLDRIYDDFGALTKIDIINYAHANTPELFYADPLTLHTLALNEFISQFWGSRNLDFKTNMTLQCALEDEAADLIAQTLNISFEEAQKAVDAFTSLDNDLGVLVKKCRGSLNKIFNNSALKNYIREQLVNNDHMSKREINSAIYTFKDFLFVCDDGSVALTLPLTNYDSLASRLFCSLKINNSLTTRVHECIHLISTRLTADPLGIVDGYVSKVGFCTTEENGRESGWAFNEFFTQYLALDLVKKQFPNEANNSGSSYNPLLPFYQDLFDKYYQPMLDSFLGWDYKSIIALFGKQNLINAFDAADELYDLSEMMPIRKMNNAHALLSSETDLKTKKELMENLKDSTSRKYIAALKKVMSTVAALHQHAEQNKDI